MSATDNINGTDVEFDIDAYLQQHLGYRYHSAAESASLTAVYVLILLTGVVAGVQAPDDVCGTDRGGWKRGDVHRHRPQLVHAHGYQLLSVFPRRLRHVPTCARCVISLAVASHSFECSCFMSISQRNEPSVQFVA